MIQNQIWKLILLLLLISSCENNSKQPNSHQDAEKEFDILESVIESSKYGIEQLGINKIESEKRDKFRIWRFPEGGAVFQELYDLDIATRNLKLNSYLIQNLTEKERKENSDLIFSRAIQLNQTTIELANLIDSSNFQKSKRYDEYCNNLPYLSDYYLIEIRYQGEINRFGLGEDIKDCEDDQFKELKNLYEVVTKIINENSNY